MLGILLLGFIRMIIRLNNPRRTDRPWFFLIEGFLQRIPEILHIIQLGIIRKDNLVINIFLQSRLFFKISYHRILGILYSLPVGKLFFLIILNRRDHYSQGYSFKYSPPLGRIHSRIFFERIGRPPRFPPIENKSYESFLLRIILKRFPVSLVIWWENYGKFSSLGQTSL